MWYLLTAGTTFAFSRYDTLRGSNGPGRSWWDVMHYDLSVTFDTGARTISGLNRISYKTLLQNNTTGGTCKMQIDLQDSLVIDSIITFDNIHVNPPQLIKLKVIKEDGVWWLLNAPGSERCNTSSQPTSQEIYVYFHGKPREAQTPPWGGGFVWAKDSTGKAWIGVACQGLGASGWWPCKDYQADEPDEGMDMHYTVPQGMVCVGNGRNFQREANNEWSWHVSNPINTYDVSFYIGDYITWSDTLMGEKGKLDLSYYVLRSNEQKAKKQFAVVKKMLHCFEFWMGPYPFYEDGYKLVDAPYLGMEHQSAVAYGNEYKMGYKGKDRSNTGVGLLFDFIIIHESGHEWFGNSITAKDFADNWIHEGFTTYTEALYAQCAMGWSKAFEYTRGQWRNIRNDKPVIGVYGMRNDGSSDKYDKGSAVVHMIRMMVDDDEKFRALLRSMNKEYYHKMVSSAELENYIINFTGLALKPFFEQYLRTINIPQLEWHIKQKQLYFRLNNAVSGFTLPIEVSASKKQVVIHPTSEWQSIPWKKGGYNLDISKDYLITVKP
jgi:aminopeptidase N